MISTIPKWVSNLFEGSLKPNTKVIASFCLSSQIKRIRFEGDPSKMNLQIGYANVIRVSETEFRNYTVSHYNVEDEIFDIIFHIHGNGVGSKFVDTLSNGNELFISPARGKKMYEPAVKQQVIIGDETSLGLACSFLPMLKNNGHQFHFYFDLNENNKDVPGKLGLENYTVFSKEQFAIDKDVWQSANFILTGNAKSIQDIRKILKSTTRGKIISHGYWLEGKKGL